MWRLTTLLLSHKRCTKSSYCPLEWGVKTRDIAVSGDLGWKGRFGAKKGGNVLFLDEFWNNRVKKISHWFYWMFFLKVLYIYIDCSNVYNVLCFLTYWANYFFLSGKGAPAKRVVLSQSHRISQNFLGTLSKLYTLFRTLPHLFFKIIYLRRFLNVLFPNLLEQYKKTLSKNNNLRGKHNVPENTSFLANRTIQNENPMKSTT
jgi:hypothetical protein